MMVTKEILYLTFKDLIQTTLLVDDISWLCYKPAVSFWSSTTYTVVWLAIDMRPST